jgi:hypothetical protein|tara:strand:- start:113 stop:427 length:315 start_codon:yes stop_codon:yes gene_type:complete
MQNEYEAEIEKLNEERRLAAERINELMKYRDIQAKLNTCAKDGYLWTLTSVQSNFDEVSQISLVCTRSGSTVVIDLTDKPVEVIHNDMDGNPIPIEIIDAARNS